MGSCVYRKIRFGNIGSPPRTGRETMAPPPSIARGTRASLFFGVICIVLEVWLSYPRYAAVLKSTTLSLYSYVAVVIVADVPWRADLMCSFLASNFAGHTPWQWRRFSARPLAPIYYSARLAEAATTWLLTISATFGLTSTLGQGRLSALRPVRVCSTSDTRKFGAPRRTGEAVQNSSTLQSDGDPCATPPVASGWLSTLP